MIEDNNMGSNVVIEKMPENSVNSFPPVSAFKTIDTKKVPSKKTKLLIIVAIIMLLTLTILYFLNKKAVPATEIPTIEEKLSNIQENVNQTAEIGLPSKEKQLELMKINAAN